MRLFKPDFYRFFALGFAAGAVLVISTMEVPPGRQLAEGIVPAAEAAPAR